MSGWTTPADIRAKVRRRWDDGTLLRALASGEGFPVQDLPARGPRASEIGADLAAARDWIAALEAGGRDGRRYEIEWGEIGGRAIGRNRIPTRVRVASYGQAWALLGTGPVVASYVNILGLVADVAPVRDWVMAHPLKALEVAGEWDQLLAAYRWLDAARGSGRFLRTIDAPGVDTKFVERQRAVLGQLLGVSLSGPRFLADLGLRAKSEMVRMRFDAGFLGLPPTITEASFPWQQVADLRVGVRAVVIVENETTFLSLDPPTEGVLLWGKGFDVDRIGRLRWLDGVAVHYWGDLDTHGFAILDQLRAWLPHTASFLMDRDTLLTHRDRWGSEPSPTSAGLTRLTGDEAALYADLVGDRYGEAIRLEQERIDWRWVVDRLLYE
ncbi:MAG TPA: Wadjet anti-phage system protein JetD domain-containing protein [Nocardioidaceae bacterium]|nr:Wadjet anti-phage system protein JetD domain-containing protein [Nocardioidaceae bacterium]